MKLRIDTLATRLRILRTAERLFSERGIDAVSLQEIGRQAGQKNRSAVQYHFADKEGLLMAILDRHAPEIAADRNRLLDEIEDRGEAGELRKLAEAFVVPVATKALDPDGGLDYVRICAQLIGHPKYGLFRLDQARARVHSKRIRRLTAAAAPPSTLEQALPRWISATGLVFHGIADWSINIGGQAIDEDPARWGDFVHYLVGAVTAVLLV